MTIDATVLVVDDDASARQAVARLVASAGYQTLTFSDASDMLRQGRPADSSCLILDLEMPGINGLELQHALADAGIRIPIIFVTGHGDIPSTVRAMKAGAVDFLSKPFDSVELLRAVRSAIAEDGRQAEASRRQAELRARHGELTEREREVFGGVVRGMLNKQIGQEMGITEKTVKVHRAHVMEKMGAGSLAELVRMADVMGIAQGSQADAESPS